MWCTTYRWKWHEEYYTYMSVLHEFSLSFILFSLNQLHALWTHLWGFHTSLRVDINDNQLTNNIPFGIYGNSHTPIQILPLWPSLLIYIFRCFSPPLTSMTKGISPWAFSPCLHASHLSLLIFIFLPLWHHGKKGNSPCWYVSSWIHDFDISFYLSDDFSPLDFSVRCCVDQYRDSCICFLSSLMVLIIHWCFLL